MSTNKRNDSANRPEFGATIEPGSFALVMLDKTVFADRP